jgi:hypothetical protein
VLRQLVSWCDARSTTVGAIRERARRRDGVGPAPDSGDSSAAAHAASVPLPKEGGRDG